MKDDSKVKKLRELLKIPGKETKDFEWQLKKGSSTISLYMLRNDDFTTYKLTHTLLDSGMSKTIFKDGTFSACVGRVNSVIENLKEKGFALTLKPDLYS